MVRYILSLLLLAYGIYSMHGCAYNREMLKEEFAYKIYALYFGVDFSE